MTMRSDMSWVAGLLSPIILRWMMVRAQTTKATRRNGVVSFPATSLVLLYGLFAGLGLCIAIGGWRQDSPVLTSVSGCGMVALSLWLWPSTIILDESGITARHIWRPTRRMQYGEIEYVSRMFDRKAIVYGVGKVKDIEINEFHIGDEELEAELIKHGVKYYGGTLTNR
jgi:hypothetical protein